MQVILLKDIKTLGRAGEVKNISDGYATNFLIPQGLATAATAEKLAALDKQKVKIERLAQERLNKEQELAVRLQGMQLEIKARAAVGRKLFAGISTEDIARVLKQQRQLIVEPKHIKLEKPLKEVGNYQVAVDCGRGMKAEIIIKIIALN